MTVNGAVGIPCRQTGVGINVVNLKKLLKITCQRVIQVFASERALAASVPLAASVSVAGGGRRGALSGLVLRCTCTSCAMQSRLLRLFFA